MSSGVRFLLKVLIAVVSYVAAFALAIYALSNFNGGDTPAAVWVIIVILAIFGFRAIKHLPFLIFSGGVDGQGFVYTMIMLAIRVLLSVFAGVFIAPWVIAKTLVSLIPRGKADELEKDSN